MGDMLEEDIALMRDIVSQYKVNGVIHIIRSDIEDRITMIVELSKLIQQHRLLIPGFKDYVEDEIRRVEDIAIVFSCALITFESKRTIPICLKKGIAQSFNKFTREEFSTAGPQNLVEAIRTVHPNPKDDDTSVLIKQILDGTLWR